MEPPQHRLIGSLGSTSPEVFLFFFESFPDFPYDLEIHPSAGTELRHALVPLYKLVAAAERHNQKQPADSAPSRGRSKEHGREDPACGKAAPRSTPCGRTEPCVRVSSLASPFIESLPTFRPLIRTSQPADREVLFEYADDFVRKVQREFIMHRITRADSKLCKDTKNGSIWCTRSTSTVSTARATEAIAALRHALGQQVAVHRVFQTSSGAGFTAQVHTATIGGVVTIHAGASCSASTPSFQTAWKWERASTTRPQLPVQTYEKRNAPPFSLWPSSTPCSGAYSSDTDSHPFRQ